MPGNPPGSKWRNTPRDKRHTRRIEVHLSAEAYARLEELAKAKLWNRSRVIEDLIMRAST